MICIKMRFPSICVCQTRWFSRPSSPRPPSPVSSEQTSARFAGRGWASLRKPAWASLVASDTEDPSAWTLPSPEVWGERARGPPDRWWQSWWVHSPPTSPQKDALRWFHEAPPRVPPHGTTWLTHSTSWSRFLSPRPPLRPSLLLPGPHSPVNYLHASLSRASLLKEAKSRVT